jgi:hypothetical protein
MAGDDVAVDVEEEPAWPTVSKICWASSLLEALIIGPSTDVSPGPSARPATDGRSR